MNYLIAARGTESSALDGESGGQGGLMAVGGGRSPQRAGALAGRAVTVSGEPHPRWCRGWRGRHGCRLSGTGGQKLSGAKIAYGVKAANAPQSYSVSRSGFIK